MSCYIRVNNTREHGFRHTHNGRRLKMVDGECNNDDSSLCLSVYGLVRWVLRNLAMPKARTLSSPKIGFILASGLKYCLFSGSWSLWALRYAQILFTTSGLDSCSPFLAPTRSASSALRARGFVSPDPLGIL